MPAFYLQRLTQYLVHIGESNVRRGRPQANPRAYRAKAGPQRRANAGLHTQLASPTSMSNTVIILGLPGHTTVYSDPQTPRFFLSLSRLYLFNISLLTQTPSSVQSLSRVRLFATPWTAACQASLPFIILDGPYSSSIFRFLRIFHIVFHSDCKLYGSANSAEEFPFLHILFFLFNICYFLAARHVES